MKECSKCKTEKDLDQYRKSCGKFNKACNECLDYVPPVGMSKCSKCKEEKPVAEFNKSSRTPNGLNRWCKRCIAIDAKSRAVPRRKTAAPKPKSKSKTKKMPKGFTPRRRPEIVKVHESTPEYVQTWEDFNLWVETKWH